MFEENNNYNSQFSFDEQAASPQSVYVPVGLTVQTFMEKREIKKIAFRTSLSMLLLFAITLIWGVAYGLISVFTGVSSTEITDFINDPANMHILQIVLSTMMFTLPFVIVAKASGYSISRLAPFEKPQKKGSLFFFLLGVAFCALANVTVSFAGSIFGSFGMEYSVDFGENPQGIFGFLLVLMSTVAVPALVEEFACRGIVLGMLQKYGDGFAIMVSSIIFGLIHGNFEQMPFAFLVGLVLGFIRIKTGSLWICCLVHAFNNFISILFDYVFVDLDLAQQNVVYTFILIACLLGGVLAVVFSAEKSDLFCIEKASHSCTVGQKYKWFFTSPAVIILIVIYVLEALTYFG